MQLEEECQGFEFLGVVLQNSSPHYAETGRGVLLPLHITLHDQFDPLLQELVNSRNVVNQDRPVPSPLGQAELSIAPQQSAQERETMAWTPLNFPLTFPPGEREGGTERAWELTGKGTPLSKLLRPVQDYPKVAT